MHECCRHTASANNQSQSSDLCSAARRFRYAKPDCLQITPYNDSMNLTIGATVRGFDPNTCGVQLVDVTSFPG
jgi:hypothetical protein